MRIFGKICVIIFVAVYLLFTIAAMYKLLRGNDVLKVNANIRNIKTNSSNKIYTIDIWGKAAIGLYLWKHILNGQLHSTQNGFIQEGYLTINDITFIYRSGPGIIQNTVPNDVEYLIIVLNGRSEEKIISAKLWLDYLPLYPYLKKVAVVLLGNELCNNSWILPYTHSQGGKIDVVFLVYDSPLIDNKEFYQWPLGVAVYRGFPNVGFGNINLLTSRSYMCNFMGTVYINSSREILVKEIKSSGYEDSCIILGRKRWIPLETEESLKYYMESLKNSDLTLCPVGRNAECYRIFEALSLGSVPVVENVQTVGSCDRAAQSAPLRLLKEHGAPLIYINSWHDLEKIFKEEENLSQKEKIKRRIRATNWYSSFKNSMCKHFVNVIKQKFFTQGNTNTEDEANLTL